MNLQLGTVKTQLMAGTIVIALLSAVGWSYAHLMDSRASETAARQDLADCREMAARIESLRHRPVVAGATELGAADLSKQIEQAGRAADFAEGSILSIEPEPARRVGETSYLEVPTQLQLRGITLRQVFTFLFTVDSQAKLNARNIRLSAPRGEETGDRWTVELTLTYTVYSPKMKDDAIGASGVATAER